MKISVAISRAVLSLIFCSCAAAAQSPQPVSSLPAGTAIPVHFPHALDAANLKVGDAVVAKTDQTILGPSGLRIPRGSQLTGTVMEVQPQASSSDHSELAIKFDSLHVRDRAIPVRVALRALASFVDSYGTRSPVVDNGTPDGSVYRQVGGDYFYQGDVVYSNEWDEVGKATHDGVVVKLEGRDLANSRNHVFCESTDTVQAVGVFASGACGVYGFTDITVAASGAGDSGAIRFSSAKHTLKIPRESTALLQVVAASE